MEWYANKWYRCNKCGTLWEFNYPDFPAKGFVVADEIASDISDVAKSYALVLLENGWMSPEQFEVFEDIDKKLEEMSMHKELWSESALMKSKEWEECRIQGKELLRLLEQ